MAKNETDKPVAAPSARQGAMTSGRQEPWHPMDRLRRQIDQLFSDFGQPGASPFGRSLFEFEPLLSRAPMGQTMPAVDISEKPDAFEICAELPGMDEKDIEIKLANGTLTIKGEKKSEREEKDKDYHYSERSYGAFQRSFTLPPDVDAEQIQANFSKGVLSLHLPKRPEAINAEKTIPIQSR